MNTPPEFSLKTYAPKHLARGTPTSGILLGDLMARHFHPQEMVLEPFLPTASSLFLWAAPGAGKTMLSMSLALAVASGTSLGPFRAPTARPVLYLDAEMPSAVVQDRIRALSGSLDAAAREAAWKNLTLVSIADIARTHDVPSLGTPEGQRWLLDLSHTTGAQLVVLDSLAMLFDLDDENSASDTRVVQELIRHLNSRNVASVVVHHSGKGGTSYRGSSSLAAPSQAVIGLVSRRRKPDEQIAATLRWDKIRGRVDANMRDQPVALVAGPDGNLGWVFGAGDGPATADPQDIRGVERVQEFCKTRPAAWDLPGKSLAALAGVSVSTAQRAKAQRRRGTEAAPR